MADKTKVSFSGKIGGFQRDKVSGAFINRASDPVHELQKKVIELEARCARHESILAKILQKIEV